MLYVVDILFKSKNKWIIANIRKKDHVFFEMIKWLTKIEIVWNKLCEKHKLFRDMLVNDVRVKIKVSKLINRLQDLKLSLSRSRSKNFFRTLLHWAKEIIDLSFVRLRIQILRLTSFEKKIDSRSWFEFVER